MTRRRPAQERERNDFGLRRAKPGARKTTHSSLHQGTFYNQLRDGDGRDGRDGVAPLLLSPVTNSSAPDPPSLAWHNRSCHRGHGHGVHHRQHSRTNHKPSTLSPPGDPAAGTGARRKRKGSLLLFVKGCGGWCARREQGVTSTRWES